MSSGLHFSFLAIPTVQTHARFFGAIYLINQQLSKANKLLIFAGFSHISATGNCSNHMHTACCDMQVLGFLIQLQTSCNFDKVCNNVDDISPTFEQPASDREAQGRYLIVREQE